MTDPGFLNLHAFLPQSYANGPGSRAVVWFQGCTLNCDGCFNPATHSVKPNILKSPADLANDILRFKNIEGISISGGEPFQQPVGLFEMLKIVKEISNLSVILLSGYSLAEIEKMELGKEILSFTDVLIAGRFEKKLHSGKGLCGSKNKNIHLLTSRYSLQEILATPDSEIIISASSEIVFSGIDPVRLKA